METTENVTELVQPARKLKLIKTTFGEWGMKLPVGTPGAARGFELKPFKRKINRELSNIREQAKVMSLGAFVAEVLGHLCLTVGGVDIAALDPKKRRLHFAMMWQADVMYIYMLCRLRAIGSAVVIEVACPNCNHPEKINGDLEDLDVLIMEDPDPEAMEYDIDLRDGFEFRDKQVNRLMAEPLRWQAFQSNQMARAGRNDDLMKSMVAQACVKGAEGFDRPFVLNDEMMDEFTKYDWEHVPQVIDANAPGPRIAVENRCAGCGFAYLRPIDWNYDVFFVPSGPNRNGRR